MIPVEIRYFCVYAYNPEILDEIQEYSQNLGSPKIKFLPHITQSLDSAIDFLNYSNSCAKLIVLEYDSNNDNTELLHTIKSIHDDPWLHGTSILVVSSSITTEVTCQLLNLGVLDIIQKDEIYYKFPSVAQIILSNLELFDTGQFIFNPSSHKKGKLILKNDLDLVPKASEILINLCYAAGFRNQEIYSKISICLNEMITNAIEHGNCGIDYHEKCHFLQNNLTLNQIIKERANLEENQKKRVRIYYSINSKKALFQIEDMGNGFDIESIENPNQTENIFKVNGRGIFITRNYVHKMEYSKKGNSVQIHFLNKRKKSIEELDILQYSTKTILNLKPGEVLIDEPSNNKWFYYILSGKLGIFVNGKNIEIITPEHIFIGENYFLENQRKSEKIIALSNSKVLPISKDGFIYMIKKYPYSGVFFAKLLSKRLSQRSKNFIEV